MLWLGVWYTPGASSSKQLGSQHWDKRIIGIVPLAGIQQQGAAFGIAPSDLFRLTLCRCCYTWLMYMIWCIYAYCALLICYHELFRYLDYYLIMISVWEAWPRLLILLIYCHWLWLIDRDYPVGPVSFGSVPWWREHSDASHLSGLSRRICSVRLCVVDVFCYDVISLTGR